MDWDILLDPSSPLYQDVMQEQIKIVNMQDGLIAAARKLAEENYPAISNADAKLNKALNSVIILHSIKMAIDINNVFNEEHQEEVP